MLGFAVGFPRCIAACLVCQRSRKEVSSLRHFGHIQGLWCRSSKKVGSCQKSAPSGLKNSFDSCWFNLQSWSASCRVLPCKWQCVNFNIISCGAELPHHWVPSSKHRLWNRNWGSRQKGAYLQICSRGGVGGVSFLLAHLRPLSTPLRFLSLSRRG